MYNFIMYCHFCSFVKNQTHRQLWPKHWIKHMLCVNVSVCKYHNFDRTQSYHQEIKHHPQQTRAHNSADILDTPDHQFTYAKLCFVVLFLCEKQHEPKLKFFIQVTSLLAIALKAKSRARPAWTNLQDKKYVGNICNLFWSCIPWFTEIYPSMKAA